MQSLQKLNLNLKSSQIHKKGSSITVSDFNSIHGIARLFFFSSSVEHRSFYYLISFVYLEEGRADNFLTSLICRDDVVYNKSVDEYISSVDHLWEAHE